MFARVSTYRTGPESDPAGPSDEAIQSVLEIPGCLGVYYLNGRDSDKAISITLWETEDALTSSQEAANRIRSQVSEAQKTQILDVEEFDVAASNLKG